MSSMLNPLMKIFLDSNTTSPPPPSRAILDKKNTIPTSTSGTANTVSSEDWFAKTESDFEKLCEVALSLGIDVNKPRNVESVDPITPKRTLCPTLPSHQKSNSSMANTINLVRMTAAPRVTATPKSHGLVEKRNADTAHDGAMKNNRVSAMKPAPRTPKMNHIEAALLEKNLMVVTPSPRKAKEAQALRTAEREKQKSEAKLRLLNHRKNLKNVQSRVSVMKPSNSFVGSTLECATPGTDSSFYVSFANNDTTPQSSTTPSSTSASNRRVDLETERKSSARKSVKKLYSASPNDLNIEFVLPSSMQNPLSKSFSGETALTSPLPRRTTRLNIADEINETRKLAIERLGPELLPKVREALRKGMPLSELQKNLGITEHNTDHIRIVKRLIYLEDAYYG